MAIVRAEFEIEVARSEAQIASLDWMKQIHLDPEGGEPISVGWIISHMVEEVARHCGHADIIREMIDGQTGE